MRFRQGVGLAVIGLGLWVMLSGCGPGLILLGGGGTGGWLGLSGSGKKDDKGSPPPIVNPGPVNTAPVAVVQSLDRRESPAPIGFRLIDAESDLIDVVIEFALVPDPQDSDFQPCTGATGGSLTGLTSSAGGTNHTWNWDYGTDLGGLAATENITIRVHPNDGTVDGSVGEMGNFVVGNSPPVVMSAQAVGATLSGNVLITFDLADSTADAAGFDVRIISTETPDPIELTGADFLGTNPIGLPGSLITSASGTTGQIVWDSELVFPFHDGQVQILITPKDQPAGFSQIGQGNGLTIGPYTLTNVGNRPPSLLVSTPPDGKTFYGDVAFRVLVQDLDANSVYVHCEYQLTAGGPYADCNMGGGVIGTVGPFATLPNTPLGYDLTWKALLDLQSAGIIRYDNCRLRLTVSDTQTGEVVDTGQFGVLLGERPVIASASVQGDDGQIPLIINIQDSAADPCTLQVGYRLDTNPSTPFIPLAQDDFTFGSLGSALSNSSASGYANVFILNTLSTTLSSVFGTGDPNQPTVQLEIIATDHPPDDNTGDGLNLELPSLAYIVGPFPVLNNPTDQSVQSLTIAETGVGDSYTILPNESRDFTATVFPPQSSPNDEVNWYIYPYWFATINPDPGPSTTVTLTIGPDTQGWQYIDIYAYSVQNPGVSNFYRMYFGDPISGIDAQPDTEVTLFEGYYGQTGSFYQFTANITPPTAPQWMFWSVPAGMGTIYSDGYYQAPSDITSTVNFNVTVATVDPTKFDTVPVKLIPRPDSVSVTGPNSVQVGTAAVSYTATITPAAAPQAVFWEIYWNGFNYGSGNDFFGRIDSNGNYTPPIVLPQPDNISIIARSQFDYYIYTATYVQLTGNPPTNFTIVMEPPTPTFVYANGQGKDFNAINFTPPDAPYVTWTVDQSNLGYIDPTTGYFTPADDIGPTSTNVTVRAHATYGGVEKVFSLQIQPRQNDAPTSITIKPSAGLLPDDSNGNVDFLALVNPAPAEQDVNWSIQTGIPNPANSGSVDTQGRYYPPYNYDTYNKDATVVVKAQSTVAPTTATVNVNVSGFGQWQAADRPSLGRNDPVGIWDSTTQRCWFVGGRSETVRGTEQDLRPWVYDGSAAPAVRWVAGPDINDCLTHYPLKNAIACARTPNLNGVNSPHLVAVIGDGNNQVSMAAMDLATSSFWFELGVSFGTGADSNDIPHLTSVSRYHMFEHFDSVAAMNVLYLLDGNTIYRFGCANGLWLPRLQSVSGQPTAPNNMSFFRDGSTNDYLVGPSVSNSSETAVLRLQLTPTPQWNTVSETSLVVPGPRNPALADCAAVTTGGGSKIITFGGKRGTSPVDEVWELNLPAGNWTQRAIPSVRPFQRYDSAFVSVSENGSGKLLLFGGRIGTFGTGIAGDLWEYQEGSNTFLPFNPLGIFPQARKYAAAAWANNVNAGYMFGGVCQYGNSNETWRFIWTQASGFIWTRFAFAPSATPPGLRAASMVYDSDNSRIIMMWGSTFATSAGGAQTAIYVLNTTSNTWGSMPTPTGTLPSARFGAAVCYDADNDRVVTFGGMSVSGVTPVLFNDLVYLKVVPSGSPAWQSPGAPSGPSTPPPPAVGAFIGYDPTPYSGSASRYLIFGGNRNPNGENANSEMFTFTPTTNQWGSIILNRPYYSRPAYDCAWAFDSSAFRRFIYAPKSYSNAVATIMGNTPEWHNLSYGPFSFNIRSAMGVYDPAAKRFFALMGEVDVPGVGPAQVATFRMLSFNG